MDWTFGGAWPWQPRFFETQTGRLHYIDEGAPAAPAVVFAHGNPTWAFLWRAFIPPLLDAGRRVVAFDHLGFGRSDKPQDSEHYRIPRHVERTHQLLSSLQLRDATLVVHDWGGPIALPFAAAHPDVIRRLAIFNTFAPALPGPMGSRASVRATGAPLLGSVLVRRRDVATEAFLFKAGLAHPERLHDDIKQAYRRPHPTPASRTAMLVFPREIPWRDRGPVAKLTQQTATAMREHFADRPTLIAWGMKDVLFGGEEVLDRWRRTLPRARVVTFDDAGHFLQEDAPDESVAALTGFV
jgi:pimeloyl-ACP methyl ester carboxylesterase